MDKSGANLAALQGIKIRQVKYLNNIVEQDHRAPQTAHQTDDELQGFSLCPNHPVWHRNDAYDQERTGENGAWNSSICRRAVLLLDDVSSPFNLVYDRQYGLIATEPSPV
ncbi:UNVERIFIED_ORG: hypothetical protein ABIC54_000738 [Burkholderia sp. 1263]|uniref:DDE domain-containing protein n=1 Tax=Paraburkholderia terricola TaxID=169427 RepID=A0ABU1M007_9BURK|nr:hypothetical protein [Paraburkholderia terricola]MDR6449949.1 hypothetical protein [Paraburkholderia terricola]